MLYIRIELWPHGPISDKRLLGEASIVNVLTGDFKTGNYKFAVAETPDTLFPSFVGPVDGFVIGHPRNEGPWKLLYRALKQVFEGEK